MPSDRRRENYNCDVTYGTNSEFGFDYLRDNGMSHSTEDQVQRGHYFAIIDEVDHALIDEAFTPMIISGNPISNKRAITRVNNVIEEMMVSQREIAQGLVDQVCLPGLEPRDVSHTLARLLLAERCC